MLTLIDLFQALDRLAEVERESLYKIAELESALVTLREERDEIRNKWQSAHHEMSTLRKQVSDKETESLKRQSLLENRIKELQETGSGKK